MRRHNNIKSEEWPAGYTRLAYIEGSGSQYIELDFSASDGFSCEAVFSYTVSQQNAYIVGNGNASSPYQRNSIQCNANFRWCLGLGDTYPANGSVSAGIQYTIHASTRQGNSYLDINGTRYITSTDSTGRTAANIMILYDNWSKANNRTKTKGRVYSMTLSDDSKTLTLFPALRDSDLKPGLFDLTNQVFYTNAGTGEFSYA